MFLLIESVTLICLWYLTEHDCPWIPHQPHHLSRHQPPPVCLLLVREQHLSLGPVFCEIRNLRRTECVHIDGLQYDSAITPYLHTTIPCHLISAYHYTVSLNICIPHYRVTQYLYTTVRCRSKHRRTTEWHSGLHCLSRQQACSTSLCCATEYCES